MTGKKYRSVVLVLMVAVCTFGGCGGENSPVAADSEPRFGVHYVQPGEQVSIPGFDLLMREIGHFAGRPFILFEVVGTEQLIGPFAEESLSYSSLENLHESANGSLKSPGGLLVDIKSVVDNEVEVEIQPYERATFESISLDCEEAEFDVGDQVVVPGGVVHLKSISYSSLYAFLWYDYGDAEFEYQGIPEGYGVPYSFAEGVSFGTVAIVDRSVTFSALCLLE